MRDGTRFIRRALVAGAALVLCALGLAACGPRPVGDLGRAQPSAMHDRLMPAAGAAAARAAGEPVSSFVLTDEEREMHNRVWRFLVAPHAHDWFYDLAVEWQRTRLSGITDNRFSPDRYYEHLRAQPYNSSTVRYRTVAHDIDIDIATLPSTFEAICAVIEMDRRRAVAVSRVERPGPDAEAEVAARRFENNERIAWFTRALRYRHTAYATALDRLLVETPHEEASLLPPRLEALEVFVRRAEAGQFCTGGVSVRPVGGAASIPSRFERGPVRELPPK